MQGLPSYGMPNTTGAKPVATVKRSSKWKQLVSLRKQMKKMKRNMPDNMEGYERSALIWGAAALFAAIFFVLLGGFLESLIILAALLALPSGIIAMINHRKARKLGSKRFAGAVMAITGMVIVTLLTIWVLILAFA